MANNNPTTSPPDETMEEVPMVDIEQSELHVHDVLCGRGVTTNRYPGNESFRSLVSLNKELYVTSTKRQKMSISRSIVEAVRSLKPPGRFLEKNPTTGLWSDIGDRKAIEKTSQALRDGAAGLRKELSEDLGDPDFLSAVFDMDTAKAKASNSASKEKTKPAKARPTAAKKSHRRTRSNPSVGGGKSPKKKPPSDSTPPSPARSSSLPPRTPLSPASPRSPPAWSPHYPPVSRPGQRYSDTVRYKGYPPSTGAGPPPYHRSHSYPAQHGPPRPPQHPHSWGHGHGPPRYPGHATPSAVHTPQSPLPPGRHQLTPNGCISKPPLSPVLTRWSPRHFPGHGHPPYHHPPPEYSARRYEYGRHHDYRPPPSDYRPPPSHAHPSYNGGRPADFWPPPMSRRDRDRHHDDYHGEDNLDVPVLDGDRKHPSISHSYTSRSYSEPPQEFTPPVTPSRRSTLDKTSSSGSVRRSAGGNTNDVARTSSPHHAKDDSTQKTVMSPTSMTDGGDDDVEMDECLSEQHTIKGAVHIISMVHQMDDKTGEREESIEFMLKNPHEEDDDLSLSPLPFEREDPTSLMELPDDILQYPISSCGPHDD